MDGLHENCGVVELTLLCPTYRECISALIRKLPLKLATSVKPRVDVSSSLTRDWQTAPLLDDRQGGIVVSQPFRERNVLIILDSVRIELIAHRIGPDGTFLDIWNALRQVW